MLLTQDKDIKDLQVGDELYRLRSGKNIYYKKIKIVDIIKRKSINKYIYIVKGSTGKRKQVTSNLNIAGHRTRFFKDYSSMMIYLIGKYEKQKLTFSKTLLQDIEYFEQKHCEFLI